MKKINIAVAGTGFGKAVHLPALKDSEKLFPSSIYNYNEDKKDKLTNETNLDFYSDWGKLINNKNIDGIIIATPPHVRFNLALEALKKNKHLLLEKPVSLRSDEILELQRVALTKNLSVCVDFEYRAVPLFMQAKKILTENELGRIYLIKFDWIMSSRSNPEREWNWYSLSEKGGGVIGALGTHAFDILNWFFGDINKVSAKTSTSIKKRPYRNKLIDVTSEDICIANIELLDHLGDFIPCQLCLSSISKKGRGFSLEIYGSEGSLFLKSENQKDYVHGFSLNLFNKKNELSNISASEDILFQKTWTDGRIAPVKRIHNWWADSIKNNTPIIPGLSEGLKSQRACEAIKESSMSGLERRIM